MSQAREAKDEIAGPLRIVGPRSAFVGILMPLLDEFCRRYPAVQPDVQLDDGKSNWVLERVDVGFRMSASAAEGVIARKLLPVQLIICAAPSYLERHGAPKSLDDLAHHRCSAFRHPATGQVLPWHLFIDAELALQAVLAGQVLGQVVNLSAANKELAQAASRWRKGAKKLTTGSRRAA